MVDEKFFSSNDAASSINLFLRQVEALSEIMKEHDTGRIIVLTNSIKEVYQLNQQIENFQTILDDSEKLQSEYTEWAYLTFDNVLQYQHYILDLIVRLNARLEKIKDELINRKTLSFIIKIETSRREQFPYSDQSPGIWAKIHNLEKLLEYFQKIIEDQSGVIISTIEHKDLLKPEGFVLTYIINFKI